MRSPIMTKRRSKPITTSLLSELLTASVMRTPARMTAEPTATSVKARPHPIEAFVAAAKLIGGSRTHCRKCDAVGVRSGGLLRHGRSQRMELPPPGQASLQDARLVDDLRDVLLLPVGHHMDAGDARDLAHLLDDLDAEALALHLL